MNVASKELCQELYRLSAWEYDEQNRRIEKVWIELFSTSEMGKGNPDYHKTPPEERRQYHIGEYGVRDNPRNYLGIPEHVPWGWANKYYEETVKRSVPAYDLGYLIRKLASNGSIGISGALDQINAYMVAQNLDFEDAAAVACIELFKKGILKKEG